MVVGDFTFDHDIEDVEDLVILCEYALFLVQCGAKVVIVLDREYDYLFQDIQIKRKVQRVAFRRYVTLPRKGETAAERYSNYIA